MAAALRRVAPRDLGPVGAPMAARFLTSWPCQDACGTIETGERVEGAPVYRCPGCDSSWIELNERTQPPVEPTHEAPADSSCRNQETRPR